MKKREQWNYEIMETKNKKIRHINEINITAEKSNELRDNVNIKETAESIYTLIVGITILSKTNMKPKQLTRSLQSIYKNMLSHY